MTSCDLTSRDLQPAINAVIQHCPGKRSILVAVNGVNSLGVFLKALLNDKGMYLLLTLSALPINDDTIGLISLFNLWDLILTYILYYICRIYWISRLIFLVAIISS